MMVDVLLEAVRSVLEMNTPHVSGTLHDNLSVDPADLSPFSHSTHKDELSTTFKLKTDENKKPRCPSPTQCQRMKGKARRQSR